MSTKLVKKYLFIPSMYGAVVWIAILMLLVIKLVDVEVSVITYALCIYVVFSFVLSFVVFGYLYGWEIISLKLSNLKADFVDRFIFLVSLVVGVFGLLKYLYDFNSLLGGESIFLVFFVDPLSIRELASSETSIGFQVSYFSWVALSYIVYALAVDYKEKRWLGIKLVWLIVAFVLFALNLFFIDRTRPVLLALTSMFMVFACKFDEIKKPVRLILLSMFFPVVFFFVHAFFTGKYDADDGIFKNFAVYLLGGVGYLSTMMDVEVSGFGLKSTFLPLAKLGAIMKIIDAPPSEILEFRAVPFLTNVATFVHPFLVDGGVIYALFLIPITIFVLDFLAINAICSKNFAGLLLWASVVVINLFSFFVPKFNATYFYIFLLINLIVLARRLLKTK